jgi:NADH-quinone oxidoreductase subunit C
MALAPAITDLEQLRDRPALARLLSWKAEAVTGAKFDRDELTIWVRRESLRELSDVTCVDWHPAEPRFEVVYSLLSMARKERIRIKVKLNSADPGVDSLTEIWPGANPFEREVFDLFGVRFHGHPYLRRIMMPEAWEGHPLRKDYPVEGYR